MTVHAKSAQMSLAYWVESGDYGDAASSPTVKELRVISDTLNFQRQTLESNEIRQTRDVQGTILGMHDVNGGITMNFGDYADDWLESAMYGSFENSTFSITTLSTGSSTLIVAGDQRDDLFAGGSFAITSSTGNDANYKIGSVALDGSDTEITLHSDDSLSDATADGNVNIRKLENGVRAKYLGVEKRHHDLHRVERLEWNIPGQVDINLQANSIAQLTFNNILGRTGTADTDGIGGPQDWVHDASSSIGDTSIGIKSGTTNPATGDTFMVYPATGNASDEPVSDQIYTVTTGGGSAVSFRPALDTDLTDGMKLHFIRPATAVTANDPFNSFDGALFVDATASAAINGIQMQINNNLTPAEVVGNNKRVDIIPGRFRVTGTISAYLRNFGLYNKFVNGTTAVLTMQLLNETADTVYTIHLPNVQYTGADRNKNQDDPILQNIPFFADYDSDKGYTMAIFKTPVS